MRKSITLFALLVCLSVLFCACTGTPSADLTTIPETSFGDIVSPEPPADVSSVPEDPTAPSFPEETSFEIHFIDVGQADSALIMCDGEAMLIDGGNSEDSSLIYSYLREHNITHIEYMVCTHAHEDHVGGLSGALNYATVETAFCPVTEYDSDVFRNFVKYLDKQSVEITVPAPGDVFSLGSSVVTILGPISASDEANNTSIVLRIDYGATSFLFTGDAELAEETEILDAGYDISCTVLKAGHHGSSTSTGYRWLREAAPEYAVISVGQGNSYGHPDEDLLSRLRDAEVEVFRTDMQGHIICRSDGRQVTFQTQRNPAADTLTGAGAGGNHNVGSEPDFYFEATEPDHDADSGITYVCNTNTYKFHYPDCSSVDQMSERNKRKVTSSRDELISQGYEPCGRCSP